MAEVLGAVASSITLATLFKLCVEAFDIIQTSRHQALDLQKLTLRLDIEKCRFYTWGEAVGFTAPAENGRCPLHSFQFKHLVHETLDILLRLFSDTSKIKSRYGCREISSQNTSTHALASSGEANPVGNLTSCFAKFSITGSKPDSTIKNKMLWVVQDRKKFHELVAEVKDLIDGLQDITKTISTALQQEATLVHRIQQNSNSGGDQNSECIFERDLMSTATRISDSTLLSRPIERNLNTASEKPRDYDQRSQPTVLSTHEKSKEEPKTVQPRNHYLYKALPGKDGLYRCPFADQTQCAHLPTKQKCGYE